jgi:hypothetical protein
VRQSGPCDGARPAERGSGSGNRVLMTIELRRKILPAVLLLLLIPSWLAAAAFSVLHQTGGQREELELYAGESVHYLDLKDLARALGGALEWESPGERLRWSVGGAGFTFEDLQTFFNAGGNSFQLTAPCRLEGGAFLVPAQFAIEFLPLLLPDRFQYDKNGNCLLELAGETPQAEEGRRKTAQSVKPGRRQAELKTDIATYRITTVVIDPGHGAETPELWEGATTFRRSRLSWTSRRGSRRS